MGLRCVGTTRTERKLGVVANYGVDIGLWVQAGDFLSSLREQTEGVDAIIDFVEVPIFSKICQHSIPKGE